MSDPIIISTKDRPLDFKLAPGTMVVINHLNGNQSIVFANERLDDGYNPDACAAPTLLGVTAGAPALPPWPYGGLPGPWRVRFVAARAGQRRRRRQAGV